MNGAGPSLLLVLLLLALLFSGQKIMGFTAKRLQTPPMTFHEEQLAGSTYRLGKPSTAPNTPGGQYPLVVYLHDAGARGSDNRKPASGLTFLGNGASTQARAFQSNFPCYVYVPQCPSDEAWEGTVLDKVIATLAHLQATYPVDPERLYLIGYSMGGSGTYELARKYHESTGRLFAGIIRLAGQSSFAPHVHEVIARSAIWLHIGLEDSPLRIEKAREAYAILKKIYDAPAEHTRILTLNGQERKTATLTVANQERAKLTEYPGVGHGISHLPFDDPAVLEWLFAQRSKNQDPVAH